MEIGGNDFVAQSPDIGETLVGRRMSEMPSARATPPKEDSVVPTTHSVRLIPIIDHAHTQQLFARTTMRTLRGNGSIRLGRAEHPTNSDESPRPIVYASKVVSRSHAEITLEHGKWYVQDVGSSSGTFLNSERLGSPQVRSQRRQLRTGDVLKFGVDYRGGDEPQFRAISVRVEVDGGADRQETEFHRQQFDHLREHVSSVNPTFESCAICLQDIIPQDALFVSPCCHLWHYRCIRTMLVKKYPFFECPMCRKSFYLEEEDEDSCTADIEGAQ